MPDAERSAGAVLKRLAIFVGPAALALPLSFALPPVDLSGSLGRFLYLFSETGGKPGIPFVALALGVVLLTRPGFVLRGRVREGVAIVGALALVVGVAALLNEHVIKPGFAVPRPNIARLADEGLLGLEADAFYGLGDKEARRAHLAGRVASQAFAKAYRLHPSVQAHWVHETGFSFPSGHSLASMTFATYFLALGLWLLSGPRRWVFFVLPAWGVGVCFTRVLLTVHSPTDVTVGGTEGVLLGTLGFLLARGAISRWNGPAPEGSPAEG